MTDSAGLAGHYADCPRWIRADPYAVDWCECAQRRESGEPLPAAPPLPDRPTAGPFSIGSSVWPGTGKAMEECGELVEVLAKLIGSGGRTDHFDGTDLLDRMHDEVADVRAALEFLVRANGLDAARIDARAGRKRALFDTWHAEQVDGPAAGRQP